MWNSKTSYSYSFDPSFLLHSSACKKLVCLGGQGYQHHTIDLAQLHSIRIVQDCVLDLRVESHKAWRKQASNRKDQES